MKEEMDGELLNRHFLWGYDQLFFLSLEYNMI